MQTRHCSTSTAESSALLSHVEAEDCLCAARGGSEALGRVVGFDGLGLNHAARVTALVVLAAGGHRAGNIAARQGADAHGKNE